MSIEFNGSSFRPQPLNPASNAPLDYAKQGDFSKVLSQVSANVVTHLRNTEKKEKNDLKTDKVKKVLKKEGIEDEDAPESIHHVVLGLKKSIQLVKEWEDAQEE